MGFAAVFGIISLLNRFLTHRLDKYLRWDFYENTLRKISVLKEPNTEKVSIALESLAKGRPGLTPSFGECLAEAASVRIAEAGHKNPTPLCVSGDHSYDVNIAWLPPTAQLQRTWNDDEVTTEHAAYGVAALLIEEHGLEIVERSKKGTGFDYWLAEKGKADFLFQNRTRLEVSGIREGSTADVDRRGKVKEQQTKVSDSMCIPAVVAVVEFSNPTAKLFSRCNM